MNQVILDNIPGIRRACIRELCGFDEQAVDGTDTSTAIRLLDQMLVSQTQTDLPSGRAAEMRATDRERLLAAIYVQAFGSRVESSINCNQCREPFDLDFELAELLANIEPQGDIEAQPDKEGVYILANGCRFRLPTGLDEMLVVGLPSQEARQLLFSRCVIDGDIAADGRSVQDAMQKLSPIVEADLDARCPECGYGEALHFSLQSYLFTAFRQERPRLSREIHRLAEAYGWSLNEILNLPRTQRRELVALVESEYAVQSEGRI